MPFTKDQRHETSNLRMIGSDEGLFLCIGPEIYTVSNYAHLQIAEYVGIPYLYYQRMMSEAPALLSENVNHWLYKKNEKRLLCTSDFTIDAFLAAE